MAVGEPDAAGPETNARVERRRRRQQVMDTLRRLDAERDAYIEAQIAPTEKVLARGPQALVTERRLLSVWRLHWPPHRGEWTHDAVTFEEVTRWSIGHRHDQRPLLRIEHPPHSRIEWVPAHHFLWFMWGNASAVVTRSETTLSFRSGRDPLFAAVRERLTEANVPRGEAFVVSPRGTRAEAVGRLRLNPDDLVGR